MAAFIASYAGPTGQPRTVTIKAANLAEARKLLRRRGIRAEELRPVSAGNTQDGKADGADTAGLKSIDLNRMFEKTPGVKEKAVFASKLAALVDAGVPIVRSLDLMATQQKLPMFKRALTKVSLDVNEGIAGQDYTCGYCGARRLRLWEVPPENLEAPPVTIGDFRKVAFRIDNRDSKSGIGM